MRYIYDLGGLNESLFWYIHSAFHSNGSIVFLCHLASALFSYKAFCFFYFALLYLRLNQLLRKLSYEEYRKAFDSFFRLGLTFSLFVLSCHLLKVATAMPRPEGLFVSSPLHKYFSLANHQYSFPSAHGGLAALLFIHFYKSLGPFHRILFGCLAFFVGISRIILGVHYPSDILWAFLLAFLVYLVNQSSGRLFSLLSRRLKVGIYLLLSGRIAARCYRGSKSKYEKSNL